jgi:hypothetical protein
MLFLVGVEGRRAALDGDDGVLFTAHLSVTHTYQCNGSLSGRMPRWDVPCHVPWWGKACTRAVVSCGWRAPLCRADMSPRGLQRSHGIMVNYLYELPQVDANNRRYLVDRIVPTSPQVDALLAGC